MAEQHHFDQVARELRNNPPLDGLWARAFADAQGDVNRARAFYIKYRADEIAASEHAIVAREREERAKRLRESRTFHAKRLTLRLLLYALMLLGFASILASTGGIMGAIEEKHWGPLVITAIFGTLGGFAVRQALKGLESLK